MPLKPTLSPSQSMTLKFCPRLWQIRYLKGLAPIERIDYKLLFGAMYHKVTEAIDKQAGVVAAMDALCDERRLSPTYVSSDSILLDHCRKEMNERMIPGYHKFLQNTLSPVGQLTTIDVERTLEVDVGPCILKCIPDKIVEDESGKLWVVERKTTSRDDSGWQRQWALNHQTTCEVIATELHYNRPVEGVLIEQVVVTRGRKRNWGMPWPQDIIHTVFYPWRPVPKTAHVKEDCIRFLEGAVSEMEWRYRSGRTNDPNPASCARCSLHSMCRGAIAPDDLLVECRDPLALTFLQPLETADVD